eukprot:SAG11_NODE_35883_length_264_cov_1.127273_1_plen_41_part_01
MLKAKIDLCAAFQNSAGEVGKRRVIEDGWGRRTVEAVIDVL